MLREKPPILSDKQIKQANERVLSRNGIPCESITIEDAIRIGDKLRLQIIEEQGIERLKAQRDADVAYFREEIGNLGVISDEKIEDIISNCGHLSNPYTFRREIGRKSSQAQLQYGKDTLLEAIK